jgi:UDP-N-acetylglucosamine enolpyruvyl transferase
MADARPFHWEFHPEPVAREVFLVEGGRPLEGTVPISGAKNAALKMLAAATLTGERCRFTNVPEIEDVRVMAETLTDLGVVVDHPAPNVYEIASGDVEWCSSRSRRLPRCAPASSCSGRCSRGLAR